MAREILTAYDVIESLQDVAGTSGVPLRVMRRVAQSAIRELVAESSTEYLRKRGRLHLLAPQTSSTITYDHTGSTYEREVTLASGTWPSWAKDASILLDGMVCDVEDVKSDTVLTLDAVLNPGADLEAGTSYVLYPRYYVLPEDFDETAGFWGEEINHLGRRVPMDELMAMEMYEDRSGDMEYYAIAGVNDLVGYMGVYLHPYADTAKSLDYTYLRKPRELRYTGHDAADYQGTVSVSTATTSVTGTDTAFSAKMVGSVIRIGDATYTPTGLGGSHPFVDERIIHAVSGDKLVLDRAPSATNATARYVITDPVDIDPVFRDAYMARCFYDMALERNLESIKTHWANYREQLRRAKIAANRDAQPQVAMAWPVACEQEWVYPGELE